MTAVCLLTVIKCTNFTKLLERLTGCFWISVVSSHLPPPVILSVSWAGTKKTTYGNTHQYILVPYLHLHKRHLGTVQSWYLLGKWYSSQLVCARVSWHRRQSVWLTASSNVDILVPLYWKDTWPSKQKTSSVTSEILQLLSTTLLEDSPK